MSIVFTTLLLVYRYTYIIWCGIVPKRKILFGEEARILVALLKHDRLDITSIIRETGYSRQAVTNNVELLIKHGLAKDEYEKQPPGRRFIYLTDKGKKIAQLIKQVLELLEETTT